MATSIAFDATQCALLVMDFQPATLSSIPNADELIAKVNRVIATVRRRGGHIVFVRFAFEDLDFVKVPPTNGAIYAAAASRQIHSSLPDMAIHPDIDVQVGDIVARKTRMGALSGTDLDERLTNLGVYTLILTGIRTSGVVLSTVCAAADRDYQLILVADCTADPNQDLQRVLIDEVFPGQAEVTTVDELDELLAPCLRGGIDMRRLMFRE